MVQPLWKIVWKFLKKLKIKLLYDSAILLLKELKSVSKRHLHLYVHCGIIHNRQNMETADVVNR